ncbi:helix-turn-helix transcriptional regulator, partial [Vibrio aestuarianus]|uniref:helix-turn-helix domain-containing protein n=2 Tax=Vibrionaceae TaxID=641 RepID=UPI002469563F
KDKLASLRKELGKTQVDVANEAEISIAVYKKYEAGSALPNMRNLIKLADLFQISIDELCGRWETSKDQVLAIRLKKVEALDDEEKCVLNTVLESLLLRHYSRNVITQ